MITPTHARDGLDLSAVRACVRRMDERALGRGGKLVRPGAASVVRSGAGPGFPQNMHLLDLPRADGPAMAIRSQMVSTNGQTIRRNP